MSGHNKWSQIKRKKETTDKAKSKNFARIGKEIRTAVKEGGADPASNAALRNALVRARDINMPKSSIERAIERGSGKGDEVHSITYEAYGPGGAALVIEAETDNKNRTVSELKHLIEQNAGRMADVGSVLWLFLKKGYLIIESKKESEKLEEVFISEGAEDYDFLDGTYFVMCAPEKVSYIVNKMIVAEQIVKEHGIKWFPHSRMKLGEEDNKKLELLINKLEERDDIVDVETNVS